MLLQSISIQMKSDYLENCFRFLVVLSLPIFITQKKKTTTPDFNNGEF